MKCNACNTDMVVVYGYDDIDVTEKPRLFRVLVHECINAKCVKHLQKVEERLEQPTGIPKTIPEYIDGSNV